MNKFVHFIENLVKNQTVDPDLELQSDDLDLQWSHMVYKRYSSKGLQDLNAWSFHTTREKDSSTLRNNKPSSYNVYIEHHFPNLFILTSIQYICDIPLQKYSAVVDSKYYAIYAEDHLCHISAENKFWEMFEILFVTKGDNSEEKPLLQNVQQFIQKVPKIYWYEYKFSASTFWKP